jgi:heme oxygenase
MTGSQVPLFADVRAALKLPSAASPCATAPLSALRAATRTHHDRIDRLMDLRRMQDRAHYCRILQVLAAFLAAWEPGIRAALPARRGPWLGARSRRAFLSQDLQALGVTALTDTIALPALPGEAAAWGSMYVLEGSALGGQVISRSLAQAGLHPHNGTAYFHGWGDQTGARWREFRVLLGAELAQPQAVEQACEAACQTFTALSSLLETNLHERIATA